MKQSPNSPGLQGYTRGTVTDGTTFRQQFAADTSLSLLRVLPVASGSSYTALDADTVVTVSIGGVQLFGGPVRVPLAFSASDAGSPDGTRESAWVLAFPAGTMVGPDRPMELTVAGQNLDFATYP